MDKFFYNERSYQWERVDNVQFYKGRKIETITYHQDYNDPLTIKNHKEYRVTDETGRQWAFPINKRGCNIQQLKEYIDFKERHRI